MVAGPPEGEVVVPACVASVAAGRPLLPVWRNEAGGLTFRVGDDPARQFIKWYPAGSVLDPAAEIERLRWVVPYVRVPLILDHGSDADGAWLLTDALPGENAVTDRWKARPATAAAAIGTGLRHLHESLPVTDCPFSWSVENRLRGGDRPLTDPATWSPEYRGFSVADVRARLADPPSIDRVVVCHGDACAPNTLLDDDGNVTGHVDFGSLGVADRWADLAVATWSTVWNFGPGHEDALLDAYGVSRDPERTDFYRLMWAVDP